MWRLQRTGVVWGSIWAYSNIPPVYWPNCWKQLKTKQIWYEVEINQIKVDLIWTHCNTPLVQQVTINFCGLQWWLDKMYFYICAFLWRHMWNSVNYMYRRLGASCHCPLPNETTLSAVALGILCRECKTSITCERKSCQKGKVAKKGKATGAFLWVYDKNSGNYPLWETRVSVQNQPKTTLSFPPWPQEYFA